MIFITFYFNDNIQFQIKTEENTKSKTIKLVKTFKKKMYEERKRKESNKKTNESFASKKKIQSNHPSRPHYQLRKL